ncbi:hypothetical protein C1646_769875 [Rhizophagus diaphanus]|nr:hypothetical protein C1646_769875 [Rhizophagus diaphanus] [Rhizophagus sp. MUCL 43196]
MATNEVKDNNLSVNNLDTSRKSIDREQEVIIIKHDVEKLGTFTEPFNKYMKAKSIKSNKNKIKLNYDRGVDRSSSSDSNITNDNKYHIAICQNGKFVATFDRETLHIKLLENTDSNYEIIEQFKIGHDFTISQERQHTIIVDGDDKDEDDGDDERKETTSTNDENSGWSIDISNLYTKDVNKYFIYVALSRIVDKDLTSSTPEKTRNGTTMIYRLELEKKNKNYKHTMITATYNISGISGICRFINESESEKVPNYESNKDYFTLRTIRRFVILNFDGIHSFDCKDNFVLSKRFYYPQCIKHELKALDSPTISDCINLLQSYIYDKYFLVENYKDSVQLLEVYNLEKMKLETITIRIENSQEKLIRKYNRNHFSISKNKQLLCFTRGLQSVKLYFMENGLEAISKKFKCIEKIYLLEFIQDKKLLVIGSSDPEEKKLKLIIWDMYNFEESETPIELDNFLNKDNLTTRLARIYGIILQIDDSGEVSSVFKELEEEKEKDIIISPANKLFESPGKKLNGKPDKRHTIYYDKNTNPYFKPIVVEKEPWVLGDYDRQSYCLYQNKNESEIETLQLIVGRSTIQVWHQITSDDKNKSKEELPNEGEPFLEYIWTNGVPVNQESEETKLRIEKFEYESNDVELNDFKLSDFSLKVYWYEKHSKNGIEDDLVDELEINDDDTDINRMEEKDAIIRMEKVIQRQDIIDKVNAVRYACKALEFINKRTKSLVNYTKEHHCEEMVAYINRIIWRFVKYKPDDFRLLDVRRNVMKNLILGDCDHLIKFILFGDNDNDEKINNLHIPRKTFWKKRKIINDDTEDRLINNFYNLGREIKDTIIVAYLLEYYSRHATDYAGWMSTISKALPLLFKYNYDDYVKKLFRKECFANQNYLSVQKHNIIIPVKYQERHSSHGIQFKAFEVNLRSDKIKLHSMIWETYKSITNKIYKKFEEWINKDYEKHPLALRVVPLPEFTINNRASQQNNPEGGNFLLNIFLFLFIPRWYSISWEEKNKLSPFARVVYYENNDDIYDNPATEAIIDFRWKRARTFFFSLFLRFLLYVLCFGLISWAYLDHSIIINANFLFTLIVIYYYLAIYLFITELLQLKYEWRKYMSDIYNFFDIFSIVFPVIAISKMVRDFHFSNGFGNVETIDTGLIVMISFSAFFLWIEVISYLRLIPNIAIYIYYVIIIIKTVLPFILFNAIMIIAFAHIMFILLYDPNTEVIKTKDTTFSGTATNPANGQELMNVTMKADFNSTDWIDNPFSYFSTAIISSYYWLNGDFVQRSSFDFWAVEVFTFIASVLLVTILQNMLIAFMSGVYETATTKGRQALLRFRANQIANYEALNQVHFPQIKSDPKYIYYIGRSKHFETWYESRKNDGPIFSDFEKKSTFSKFVFEEKDYDEFSLWKYDIDFEGEIKKFNIMKKSLNNNIKNLKKNFDQKNGKKHDDIDDIDIKKEIEEFKIKKKSLNDNIDNLLNYFEEQKIQENGNVDINIEIGKFKTMKNNLNDNIENLIKIFEDQKNVNVGDNIDINKIIEDLNDNINNLIKNLVRKCNKNSLNDNIDELIKNLEDQKSDNDVNNNIEINKKIEILKAIKY